MGDSHRSQRAETPEAVRLAQSIFQLRQRAGLSQERLGQLVGLGRGSICNIETSKQGVSTTIAVRLADALGVSMDRLYGFEGSTSTTDSVKGLEHLEALSGQLDVLHDEMYRAELHIVQLRRLLHPPADDDA